MKPTKVFYVQAILNDQFEDLYIKLPFDTTRAQVIEAAKKVTTIKHRFTRFAI